ncbi:MAG: hypothetical protein IPM99_11245 [Rubrivivax sp.]|nr:hypothetical protein [Rubrivivax sp.]
MNPVLGWGLAVVAVAAGYVGYGWPGVLLAVTVIVFWLLLQFSRAPARRAGRGRGLDRQRRRRRLHARLRTGMRLLDILPLTLALGQKVADRPETFVWTDRPATACAWTAGWPPRIRARAGAGAGTPPAP